MIEVGQLVRNRSPENCFDNVEQDSFSPISRKNIDGSSAGRFRTADPNFGGQPPAIIAERGARGRA